MFPRLLSLLCLLVLLQTSLTQESGTSKPARVPETCPVWLLVWLGRAVDNSARRGGVARAQTENRLVAARL